MERSRSSLSTNTLDETRAKIEQLSARISELEAVNLGLQQRMSERAQRLEDERFTHRAQVKTRHDILAMFDFVRNVSTYLS